MSFFRLSESPPGSHPSLVEISTQRPLDKDADVLLLSCAWHPSQHDILAITTSDFEVHVLKVDDDWTATPAMSSPAIDHALEAWTVAFSPLVKTVAPETEDGTGGVGSEIVIYSGGDDSKLLYRSCGRRYSRESDDEDLVETLSPTTNIRGHEAGVTAILPLDLNLDDGSSVVISGSYDDHIRVYAVPQFGQRAKLLAEENLDGGVWRLKLVNVEKQESGSWGATVLASCMHAGSRVVKIAGTASGDGDCKVEVLCRFEEHKSMNYGSDFQPGSNHGGRPLRCVSTSFYDRLLCFWTYDLPI